MAMDVESMTKALGDLAEQVRLSRHPRPAQLLSLEECGDVLGRSPKTVRRYIDAGWLTAVRLPAGEGSREGWMIQSSDLQAFINSRKSRPPEDAREPRRERDSIRRTGKITVPRLIG